MIRAGSLWKEGEERAGDKIPKRGWGRGFCNTVQYFEIGKEHRDGNRYGSRCIRTGGTS